MVHGEVFGNTNFNTMPFNAEDFDSRGNYNAHHKFCSDQLGR